MNTVDTRYETVINVGTAPNAGDGEPLRDAFVKLNNYMRQLDGVEFPVNGDDFTDILNIAIVNDSGQFEKIKATSSFADLNKMLYIVPIASNGDMAFGITGKFIRVLDQGIFPLIPQQIINVQLFVGTNGELTSSEPTVPNSGVITVGRIESPSHVVSFAPRLTYIN